MNKKRLIQLGALIIIELLLLLPIAFSLQFTEQATTTDIKSSQVTVEFATDVQTTAKVEFGTTRILGESVSVKASRLNHQVILKNLDAATKYFFRVTAKDESTGDALFDNNLGQFFTFTTRPPLDTTAPEISNFALIDPQLTSLTLSWTTDDLATSQVRFGERPHTDQLAESTDLTRNQRITLTDLEENKFYSYKIKSCNIDNLCTEDSGVFRGGVDQRGRHLCFHLLQ